MSKYNIGDVVMYTRNDEYIILDMTDLGTDRIYYLLSIPSSMRIRSALESFLDTNFVLTMSSPKVYTGPLTQEEIDEIIESYNNSVQAIPGRITTATTEVTNPYGYHPDNVDFSDRDFGDTGFVYKEPPKLSCKHEFVGVQLLMSTVYNCKKCGIKKEDI